MPTILADRTTPKDSPFKAGDTVRSAISVGYGRSHALHHGSVALIGKHGDWILCRFPGISGHDGNDCGRVKMKTKDHWWVAPGDLIRTETKSTQKPKEPKTMTATKKPVSSHGKPAAKGRRVEKKPTAAKVSKYPAARVQIVALVPVKPLDKMTKAELIEAYGVLKEQFDNQAADHCIAGTKLDRALVDLKEAKKRIKELTKGTEAAK